MTTARHDERRRTAVEDRARSSEHDRPGVGPSAVGPAAVIPIAVGSGAPGPDDEPGSNGAGTYGVGADGSSVLRIDCADCDHQDTPVCRDCLVTFLCDREDDGAVVVPISEIRAVRLLQGAGLAPQIRHRSRRVG